MKRLEYSNIVQFLKNEILTDIYKVKDLGNFVKIEGNNDELIITTGTYFNIHCDSAGILIENEDIEIFIHKGYPCFDIKYRG